MAGQVKFSTCSAGELEHTNPAVIAQGAARRRRFLFTRQIHLARFKSFEAEKEFSQKSAFDERKKSLDFKVASPNSGTPPLVVSILRGNLRPAGNRWRT